MPVKENRSIELFNKARKHAFSVLNKYNSYEKAQFFLKDSRYTQLSPTSKTGLLAELLFYSKYKRKLKLTPALDCGDKTDFTGEIENQLFRIDVTTNLKYKKTQDYEDFVQDGWAFWLVNVDIKSEDIAFIPLHFPLCEVCNKASLFNLVYLKQDLFSTYIDHFTIIVICPYCITFEQDSTYEWDIQSFFSDPDMQKLESALIDDYIGKTELRRNLILDQKGINHWVLEKGGMIAQLAKTEYNAPIAYIGEEPMSIEMWKKSDQIAPIILWNNLWATSDINTLLSLYIKMDG
ncbi:MAG: hypothetical protein ACFE9L_11365 [Candidatus Hodarchaeota archaeon]